MTTERAFPDNLRVWIYSRRFLVVNTKVKSAGMLV
jgi:hypothetical protein